jgi:hypothetical protein
MDYAFGMQASRGGNEGLGVSSPKMLWLHVRVSWVSFS